MGPDYRNIVEFYRTGETRPFARRNGLFNVPAKGHLIDAFGVRGEVVGVTWNMDYVGRGDEEQWRCNIYVGPTPETVDGKNEAGQ